MDNDQGSLDRVIRRPRVTLTMRTSMQGEGQVEPWVRWGWRARVVRKWRLKESTISFFCFGVSVLLCFSLSFSGTYLWKRRG